MLSLATLLLIATGGCSYTLINHDTDTYTSAADALIDLSVDFNETVNVLDEDNYSDSLSLLRDRADYWSGQLSVITEVDTSSNKNAFKKCGGICPWLDDGNEVEMKTVDQMYSTSNAPNIVFVLIDDWGWNDAGYTSTYLSWTTPHIDKIAKEGVKLTNYYASFLCNPARSSLMTGRYPIRTGTWKPQNLDSELPLDETTLAEEMKSAGYRTYMVGKWHLGYSATGHLPTYRGFDEFYGFYGGDMDYWTKSREDGLIDLQDNNGLVTDTDALSADLHSGYLFETKAEDYIADHATNYADEPLFMYYAMQLVHAPWAAPDRFLSRCEMPEEALTDTVANDIYTFCAMNVMLDEAIANLTCALNANGMADNTVLIVASDNGGEVTISGNSYPYRGNKGSYWNGGIKANAFIHSPLLSEDVRGTSYSGLMHITDWLPTLMGLATGNEWTGSLNDAELDGVDMWDAINSGSSKNSPRTEIVHYYDNTTMAIQIGEMKLVVLGSGGQVTEPLYVFEEDQAPDSAQVECKKPSLISGEHSSNKESMASSKSANIEEQSTSSSSSSSSSFFEGFYKSSSAFAGGIALLGAVILITTTNTLRRHTADRHPPVPANASNAEVSNDDAGSDSGSAPGVRKSALYGAC